MEKAATLLNDLHVRVRNERPLRSPYSGAVEEFASARKRGIKVIIAGSWAWLPALPGVIAANNVACNRRTHKGSVLDGVDALYSIIQMPPGM